MNVYTVMNGEVHIGIALSRDEKQGYYYLQLGKKKEQAGQEIKIVLSPDNPASHVLVAGGVHLMRTAKLCKSGDEHSPKFVFTRARMGLKTDSSDHRALVLVDFTNLQTHFGYIPKSYEIAPVYGYEVFRDPLLHYHMQGLVILQPGEHFAYRENDGVHPGRSYTVAYSWDKQTQSFPRVECVSSIEFRARAPFLKEAVAL